MGAQDLVLDAEGEQAIWEPQPRQAEFLAASEDEVLFGGAVGGGKTDALVIDALGLALDAYLQPRYRAIIFRREFPQLRDVIGRSQAIYPQILPGAEYNESKHEWRLPSGAMVYFGHLQHDKHRFAHQGQEYQWIGFEELTQWATPVCWDYLKTRNRGGESMGLPDLMRATTNPGGVGGQWVQEHWGIPDDGSASRRVLDLDIDGEVLRVRRRFIPSRLSDNRYLGRAYRAKLAQIPEAERKALIQGRWDVVEIPGQIYKPELEKLYATGRVTRVPYDRQLPVHTIWDLGMSDSTSIWFVQLVNREVRVIDYYEASGEGLAHYAEVLQSRGYVYGTHIAPHDIRVREMGTGKSRLEIAEQLGIRFDIAPQLGLEDGISAARDLFERAWFDRDKTEKTGLRGLKHYRRDYNIKLGEFVARPVHDWASHPADAWRYVAVSVDMLRNGLPAAPRRPRSTNWRTA